MDRDDKDHDSRFARMQAQYAAYRSYRIQEQAMYELAEAFENETQPTTLRTVEQVVRLEGTLASQYNEWRRLLRDIFILEQEYSSDASLYGDLPAGVGVYLAQELAGLGAVDVVERPIGVQFSGDLGLAYRVCLWSRLANRVILDLGSHKADTGDAVYEASSELDWLSHIPAGQSLMVDFTGKSRDIRRAVRCLANQGCHRRPTPNQRTCPTRR